MNNFEFKNLILAGFRSFKDRQVIKLNREPGLYFISGNNIRNPELGSNAVGKSSIFDAVSWILEGKTVGGLRGQVIINGSCKSCFGSLELSKNGQDYVITRTQSPNSLTIIPPLVKNGEPQETIVQADLDEFIGLSYEKFLYTCIVGQFNASFLDLGPTDKLNLFSDIMSLSMWEECSKRASAQATHFQNKINLLETQKNGISGTIEGLKAEEEALQGSSDGFERTRQGDLEALNRQIKETFEAITESSKQERKYKELIDKIDTKNTDWFNKSLELKKEINTITSSIRTITIFLTEIQTAKSVGQEELNKWKKLDICPYCLEEVNPKIITTHKNKATKQLIILGKEIIKLTSQKTVLEEKLKIAESELIKLEDRIALERGYLTNWHKEYGQATATKQLKTTELKQLKKQAELLQSGINPYTDLIKACQAKMSKNLTTLGGLETELASLHKDHLGNQYWIKGFKELRLWVVYDALQSLEIESNNVLAKLGLAEWELRFQIERETATGDISKGFHALVKPPMTGPEEYVPLAAYSGGEKQRLKLAGVIGLSSLIQSYKGVNFNISIFDEPTTFLSGEGTDNLIEFLAEEARTKNKVIYFIDHHQIESPHFKEIIQVEKTKDGSRIIS